MKTQFFILFIFLFSIPDGLALSKTKKISSKTKSKLSKLSTDSSSPATRIDTSIDITDILKSKSSEDEETGPVRLGDRQQIYNKLYNIFKGDDEESNGQLTDYLFDTILKYPSYFGGSCDPFLAKREQQDTRYIHAYFKLVESTSHQGCFNEVDLGTPLILTSSVAREGLKIQACFNIIGPHDSTDNDYVKNAFSLICGEDSCDLDTDNVSSAYKLFYPYINLIEDDKSEFVTSFESESNPLKKFLYTVCLSPSWQAF